MSFHVLVVCTGNICRSPIGHLLLDAPLGDEVTVSSAGTRAMVGHPVQPELAALLPPAVDASGFAASQLTPARVKEADLVLAMTREHRQAVVEMFPGALRRSFTYREFARLMALPEGVPSAPTPADALRSAVAAAGLLRPRVRTTGDLDDIADPYQRGQEAYARAYAEISEAARAIIGGALRS